MASPLVDAHIEAQRRLRLVIAQAATTAWRDLGNWDRSDIADFTSAVVPAVLAGQRLSVTLTDAYLSEVLKRRPLGVDADKLIGAAVRNGVTPEEVYSRPFVTLWTALKDGRPFEDAFKAAEARVNATAEMDVQLSSRAAYGAVQEEDDGIYGYVRVADAGACEFCAQVDGAYVKDGDAMPLHNRCGCGLEPLSEPHPRAATLPSGVAVHDHGELGAVLTDPSHDFTTAAQALA